MMKSCILIYMFSQALGQQLRGTPRERRLQLRKLSADEGEQLDVLPEVEVSGFRLVHHFILDKFEPWRVTHIEVPEDYVRVKPSAQMRRMQQNPAMLPLLRTPVSLANPQSKIRFFSLLNAIVQPNVQYSAQGWNVSTLDPSQPSQVWEHGQQYAFQGVNLTGKLHNEGDFLAAYASKFAAFIQNDTSMKLQRGDLFAGARYDATGTVDQLGSTGITSLPRGPYDIGISISVYDSMATGLNTRIAVFGDGWTAADTNYFLWKYRVMILEYFQEMFVNQWAIDAQQTLTQAQVTRSDKQALETISRCTFANFRYTEFGTAQQATDVSNYVNQPAIKTLGYWPIVKLLVNNDKVFPGAGGALTYSQTIYATGFGLGGTHAALVNMLMLQAYGKELTTYAFAPVGLGCDARLYSDMDASVVRKPTGIATTDAGSLLMYSLVTIAHVMDPYRALDIPVSSTCLFGRLNMTGTDPVSQYCGNIVGFSGPQLWFRGTLAIDPAGIVGVTKDMYAKLQQGWLDFQACTYYTHTAWYTALLLNDDRNVDLYGNTDGGCSTKTPTAPDDPLGHCPTSSDDFNICKQTLNNAQELPIMQMIYVSGGLTVFIIFAAACGLACMRRVRKEKWAFGSEDIEVETGIPLLVSQIIAWLGMGDRSKAKEREEQARQRAKDKRLQERKKQEALGAAVKMDVMLKTMGDEAHALLKKEEKKKAQDDEKKAEEDKQVAEDEAATREEEEGDGLLPPLPPGDPPPDDALPPIPPDDGLEAPPEERTLKKLKSQAPKKKKDKDGVEESKSEKKKDKEETEGEKKEKKKLKDKVGPTLSALPPPPPPKLPLGSVAPLSVSPVGSVAPDKEEKQDKLKKKAKTNTEAKWEKAKDPRTGSLAIVKTNSPRGDDPERKPIE